MLLRVINNYNVFKNGGGGALLNVEETVFFVLIASKSLNTGSSLPSLSHRRSNEGKGNPFLPKNRIKRNKNEKSQKYY